MALSVGRIFGEIELRDQFTAKLRQIAGEVDKAMPRIKGLQDKLQGVGAALTGAGVTMSAAVTAPIVGMGYAAIKAGNDFQGAMNRVKAALPHGDVQAMTKAAQEMGAATVFSSTEAALGMVELGKAGLDSKTVIAALPSVLELAVAGQMDMAEAATLSANTMSTFNLTAADMAKANDTLAKAAASSTIDVRDLAEGMKYVGPLASVAGMSLETTAAAMAIMGEAGIKGSMAGTALRGTMSALLTPTAKQAELMKDLGLQSAFANGKMMPLADILKILEGQGNVTSEVMELFGDRAGPGLLALLNKGSEGLVKMEKSLDDTGFAARQAKGLMEGMPGALERLSGSVDTAFVALGEVLAPVVIAAADAIGKLADFITTKLVPLFNSLPTPIKVAIGAFVALMAAIGPILLAVGTMTLGFSSLIPIWGGASIALKAVGISGWAAAAPLAAIVGSVAALIIALPKAIDGMKNLGMALHTGNWSEITKRDYNTWFGRMMGWDDESQRKMKFGTSKGQDINLPSTAKIDVVAETIRKMGAAMRESATSTKKQSDELDGLTASVYEFVGPLEFWHDSIPLIENHKRVLVDAGKEYIPLINSQERLAKSGAWPKMIMDVERFLPIGGNANDILRDIEAKVIEGARSMRDLGGAIMDVGDSLGDTFAGSVVMAVGRLVDAWGRATEAAVRYSKASVAIQRGMVAQEALTGTANVIASTGQGSMGQRALGGAMSGASAGIGIGMMVGGPVGAAWGAAIGGTAGLIAGLIRGATAASDFDKAVKEIPGGLVALSAQAKMLGVSMNGPVTNMRELGRVKTDIQAVTDMMGRYDLTWRDLGETAKQANVDGLARQLLADAKMLGSQGVDAISKMGKGFSQIVIDAVGTGTKVPAALQPMLESLIRAGKLSEEAARSLLGMGEDATPSLDDISSAAQRLGIELDKVGGKVPQLRITAEAEQMARDFETLINGAGANADEILTMAQGKVQELVTMALSAGLVLPETLRPWLQRMVDAGQLLGLNGEKLQDLSGIKFETPLSQQFDKLIEKLGELIDAFSKVGTSAEEGFGRARKAAEQTGTAVPRGSAVTPADPMSGSSGGGRSNPATINVNMDGRTVATAMVPHLSDAITINVG